MKVLKTSLFLILLFPTFIFAQVLAEECNLNQISGKFNLIIYSNSFINDPETFIVLDVSDDKISFKPYAPDFKYSVQPNLNDKEALKIVKDILTSANISTLKCTVLRDSSKNIVGYEIKPLYFLWVWGVLKPVDTRYKEEGDIITIFIRLDPRVERQLNSGGDSFRED
ncbi:hypothetical protein [Thermodesulfovibrio hydrogeniphilus]